MILQPNGKRAIRAYLKHWTPNGIPMIVIHHTTPIIIEAIVNSHPKTRIHTTFRTKLPNEFENNILFPKGQSVNLANLKHWTPIGIYTTVIQQRIPATHHRNPSKAPPKRTHKTFPSNRNYYHLFVSKQRQWTLLCSSTCHPTNIKSVSLAVVIPLLKLPVCFFLAGREFNRV